MPSTPAELIGSFLLFWVLGLVPAILVRFAIVGAQVSNSSAILLSAIIGVGFFIFYFWIWTISNIPGWDPARTARSVTVLAFVCYGIFRIRGKSTANDNAAQLHKKDSPTQKNYSGTRRLADKETDLSISANIANSKTVSAASRSVETHQSADPAPSGQIFAAISWPSAAIGAAAVALIAILAALLFLSQEPKNFDECKLMNLSKAKGSDLAAGAIISACRRQFPAMSIANEQIRSLEPIVIENPFTEVLGPPKVLPIGALSSLSVEVVASESFEANPLPGKPQITTTNFVIKNETTYLVQSITAKLVGSTKGAMACEEVREFDLDDFLHLKLEEEGLLPNNETILRLNEKGLTCEMISSISILSARGWPWSNQLLDSGH